MITAARVADTFQGLDPVAILADADGLAWAIRVAAHNIIVRDREKRRG